MFSRNDTFRFIKLETTAIGSDVNYRSEYSRDYARVLHSPSFRRLQGKTQLFPTLESDFFRNRLTHSLEVSQIAKSIALKLKAENPNLDIEPDVCEIAGLVHDIGHPPFGHNGESALDKCMCTCGGFEGNAQTIRILTRLEKKECPPNEIIYDNRTKTDKRVGLNLTARVIASALKYDNVISVIRDNGSPLVKGYYDSEKDIIDEVKNHLVDMSKINEKKFKTIECSIMDIADDIAYSTYDIEDAFKANFLTPYDILAANDDILETISSKLKRDFEKDEKLKIDISVDKCREILLQIFKDMLQPIIEKSNKAINSNDYNAVIINNLTDFYRYSNKMASDGFFRTSFTSSMVNSFINGVCIEIDKDNPILSRVYLDNDTLLKVNILKHFSYVSLIDSSRLKVAESRGYEIITKMFDKLCNEGGQVLLPEDTKKLYKLSNDVKWRKRVICDFIAGMTDRYALEFYGRLFSQNPQTIFKPL